MSLALALSALAACSTASIGPGGRISKVKHYHLVPGTMVQTIDTAVAFERDHHLYGAVTRAETRDRLGHYYTIFWKADDRSTPVKVVFDYRQANSGLTLKSMEFPVDEPRRSNATHFQVTGDDYHTGGRVTSWRVRLMRGNEELASQRSYLWN
ncbi:MAG TPA: hypothetical protein DIT64_06895 [Verrucomicrobiales bacterium]|nr:hypothetical protein [Verrucomicrobiales bacterium]HCN76032.1 hypothetical protein [Verrucomicrobiales bacterium]